MSIRGNARTGFATSADIGRCMTDRTDTGKDGVTMKVSVAGRPRLDYFDEGEMLQYTQSFFDKFRLPIPEQDAYRGNSQDLLFFNGLGFVVRTGPMDIVDMIHPGVLQPLYWMPFDNTGHVIGMYPGIQLPGFIINNDQIAEPFQTNRMELIDFMNRSNQLTRDTQSPHNFGYINNRLVVLDTEDQNCGTKWKVNKEHKKEIYNKHLADGLHPFEAIRQVMIDLYSDQPEFDRWISAYDYHQPLRAEIDIALSEPDIDLRHEMLRDFYQSCRDAVNGAHPDVALDAPWTGQAKDNTTKTKGMGLTR
jgi:hypothetical protein